MEVATIIVIVVALLIGLFDLMPYCLATIVIGRFPPGGPYVWQFLKRVFRGKPRYATWKDIP